MVTGVKKHILIGLVLAGILAVGTHVFTRPVVQYRLKRQVIQKIIAALQPKIPLRIEELDFDADWGEIHRGQLRYVRLALSKNGLRLALSGPFDIDREQDSTRDDEATYRLTYHPEVRASIAGRTLPPFSLELWAEFEGKPWSGAIEPLGAGAEIKATHLKWEITESGIAVQNPFVTARWRPGDLLHLRATAEAIDLFDSQKKDRALHLEGPSVRISTDLDFAPFELGPEIRASAQAKKIELADGDLFIDESLMPWRAEIRGMVSSSPTLELESLILKLIDSEKASPPVHGARSLNAPSPLLTLEARHEPQKTKPGQSYPRFLISARTRELELPALVKWASQLAPLAFLKPLTFSNGKLSAQLKTALHELRPDPLQIVAQVSEIDARAEEAWSAIKGSRIDVSGAYDFDQGSALLEAKMAIPRLGFRHFRGSLAPSQLKATFQRDRWKIEAPKGLALSLGGIPLTLGSVAAEIGPEGPRLKTSLKAGPMGAEPLYQGNCADPRRIAPPAKITAEFSSIELSPESIEFDGGARVEAFGGVASVKNIGISDLLTEIPEFRLSAEWNGIRLDEVGKWSGFGKMDGTLRGHVRNLVSRAWLAPDYDLLIEATPLREDEIVFSGEAMRNLLAIFAGGDLRITGIPAVDALARWTLFGLPSDIAGGWDVSEAGLKVHSENGSVVVETTTSDEVFQKEGAHFMIYSRPVGVWPIRRSRVKVPINTKRYPLIMDADAFYRQARIWMLTIENVVSSARARNRPEEGKKNENDDSLSECQPPEL